MRSRDRMFVFDVIDSTHKYLKKNFDLHSNGDIVIANTQNAGIGTKNHVWYTGNENIAMSIIYKPKCKVSDLDGLTLEIAKILQETIRKLCNLSSCIKLPNDLFINDKKVCGILVEANSIGETVNFLIVSVGLNVNEVSFPDKLKEVATSLRIECGKYFDVDELIGCFVNALEDRVNFLHV